VDRIEEIMRRCFRTLNPDLAAFYVLEGNNLVLDSFKGCIPERKTISADEEAPEFIISSGRTLSVLNIREKDKEFFKGIMVNGRMTSGIASAYGDSSDIKGVFFFNYLHPYRFSFSLIREIEKITSPRREL